MSDQLVAEIRFPTEWLASPDEWLHCEHVLTLEHKASGARMFVAGGVLKGGTNLIGMTWSGGQNVARLNASEGWALEERVDPDAPEYAREVWGGIVESMIHGKRATEAELGGL